MSDTVRAWDYRDEQIARLTAENANLADINEKACALGLRLVDALREIAERTDRARRVYGQGHVCDLRSALDSAIDRARRALADADTGEGRGEGWIACSERMPSRDTGYWVLGWNGRAVDPIHWDLNEHAKNPKPRWTKNDWSVYRGEPITHWRPLPAPPTTADGKEEG